MKGRAFLAAVVICLSLPPAWIFAQAPSTGSPPSQSALSVQTSRNARRRQWFGRGRLLRGESAAALRYRAELQKLHLRNAQRSQRVSQASPPAALVSGDWISVGPAPITSDASGIGLQDYNYVAGPATAVAIDAADPTGNTVYAGTAYGGLWKSTNAGPLSQYPAAVTWTSLTDNQPTLAIGSIAIQPNNTAPNSSVILVGTGETNSSAESYYGLGILRSADAGETWTLIQQDNSQPPRPFAGLGFAKIAFSSNNTSSVVAAAGGTGEGTIEDAENPAVTNRGIYSSGDAGVTWAYSALQDGNATISPSSVSSVVYNAAAAGSASTPGLFFAAVSLHGFYSSPDGAKWTRLPTQPGSNIAGTDLTSASCPSTIASPSLCPMYRGEIAVVPGRNEMYVWYVDANDDDGGIWESLDGGGSWKSIDDSGITNCGDLFGGCGTSQGSYNLALAAVPDGNATDVYAGAVNLYKCVISIISPNCSGTGSGTFNNLTHVYGCSSIAKVNPAQHSMAFILLNNNTEDLMYFANDGGIYRALDGYSGLTTGSCGGSNLFESLNQTLGSIAQLISFSQSSSSSPNPQILLAGAQENGSPGTDSSQSSTAWENVNAGEGGYTAISPADDNSWFISTPPDSVSGVNIFQCAAGINCHTDDFQNNQVVSGTTVGDDTGAFNTPYILDSQNSGEMIVGTCRVWRGPATGGSFTSLSNSFETGGTGICSGTETNLVRTLATGGALDANGLSNVIYAGTDGDGPLNETSPNGGHLWISSNIAGGPPSWNDRTGPINPQHFPISAIAVDMSDPSGLTAYAAIMGFGVSHIWKTSNGGLFWEDFSANLPDAPANAVIVDASSGVVYVGTDVGVFASSTGVAAWSEVGPAADSNTPGFLPNVAVTALSIFGSASGPRWLRASTYGRGLWQLAQFSMTPPIPDPITVPVSATSVPVEFQLTGAGGNVSLSCTPAWAKCSFSPGAQLNIPSPVTMTVTPSANAPNGASTVAIHATLAGSSVTVTQNLTVIVTGGFGFSITNTSGALNVLAGQSAVYNLNVAPSGGTFPGAVNFTCPSGLPALATCSFNPTQIAAGSGATTVELMISTAAGTPPGYYSAIVVNGVSGSITASTDVALTVQGSEGFSFSITDATGPQTINAGQSAIYALNISPSTGVFPNLVALACSGLPVGSSCSFNPSQVDAGNGTTSVMLTLATTVGDAGAGGTPAGNYTITVTGTSGSLTASTAISLSVTGASGSFSFSLSQPSAQTIAAGSTATFDINVTPSYGTFPNAVMLSFTACPQVLTCSLSATQIAAGSGAKGVVFTIATTGPAQSAYRIFKNRSFFALSLLFPGLVMMLGGPRAASRRKILLMALTLVSLGLCFGCGGLTGGSAAAAANPGTPVGVYTVMLNATCGSFVAAPASVTLTVGPPQ